MIKQMLSILTVSLTVLVTSSAMAESQYDHRMDHQDSQMRYSHTPQKYNKDYDDRRYKNDKMRYQNMSKHHIKPARDWRVGQTLPRQFNPSTYAVSYKDASRLYRPNNNQQWLKINGDYVLINDRNHKIVRIIA